MGRKFDHITTTLSILVIIILTVALINRINTIFHAMRVMENPDLTDETTGKENSRQLRAKPVEKLKDSDQLNDDDCKFGFHFLRSFLKPESRKEKKTHSLVTIKRPVSGALRQHKMCADSMDGGIDSSISMFECHGQGRNQEWTLTKSMLIESNGQTKLCLSYHSKKGLSVLMQRCNEQDKRQKWVINAEKGTFSPAKDSNLCLDSSKDFITVARCDMAKKKQKWSFIVTEILSLEIQSQNHM